MSKRSSRRLNIRFSHKRAEYIYEQKTSPVITSKVLLTIRGLKVYDWARDIARAKMDIKPSERERQQDGRAFGSKYSRRKSRRRHQHRNKIQEAQADLFGVLCEHVKKALHQRVSDAGHTIYFNACYINYSEASFGILIWKCPSFQCADNDEYEDDEYWEIVQLIHRDQ